MEKIEEKGGVVEFHPACHPFKTFDDLAGFYAGHVVAKSLPNLFIEAI